MTHVLRALLLALCLIIPATSWADTSVATDTFSVAGGDLPTVDTSWSINGPNAMKINSTSGAGLAQSTSAGNDSGARWNANAFNNDQYSSVVLGTSSTAGGQGAGYGPAVRWDTSGAVKTGFRYICNVSGYELMKFVSGTGTSISTAATPVCADGDTIYLSATTSGSDVVLVVKQNGNPIVGSPFTAVGANAAVPSGAAGIAHSSSTDTNNNVGITSWDVGYGWGRTNRDSITKCVTNDSTMMEALMRNRISIVLLMGLLLLSTVPVHAVTFWEETFETPAMPNWVPSVCAGDVANCYATKGIGVDTASKLNGTYGWHENYDMTGVHGGFFDRSYPATSELYWRYWEKLSLNWTFNPAAEGNAVKGFNLGAIGVYPNYWIMHENRQMEATIHAQVPAEACVYQGTPRGNGLPYDSCSYFGNLASGTETRGQWYCIEGHIKNNTRGVADGIVDMWVNGVQTAHYTGRTLIGPNDVNCCPANPNSGLMQFSNIRVYEQGIAASGDKYFDDLAVGNTRIGCGAAPPPDTTPPATPVGLAVH